MKKTIVFLLVSFLTVASFAQNEKYTTAMKKNIAMIDSSFARPESFLSLANTFERIGNTEKKEWLPFYYAAYCRVNYAFTLKDPSGNDAIADIATVLINKADSLQPDNSEISCVKSMIATLRLIVNPQQRFMEYGMKSENELKKSKIQDPSNPRPYLLKGQSLKYTPQQFGGGCDAAKPELETAMKKFADFKPAGELNPSWGKERAEMLLKECN